MDIGAILITNNAQTSAFNFYAAGDAPNYFAGEILTSLAINRNFLAQGYPGIKIATISNSVSKCPLEIYGSWKDADLLRAVTFTGATSSSDESPKIRGNIKITQTGITVTSSDGNPIRIAASSDNVLNATALSFNASNVVKLLQPKQFELGGRQQLGFLAPEIEPHIPFAVEESTDEETGISEKEYDPLALIPLLTKALQEALALVLKHSKLKLEVLTNG